MNEIRFNNQSSVREEVVPTKPIIEKVESVSNKKGHRKIFFVLAYVLLGIVIILSLFFGYQYFVNNRIATKPYVAVFLSNGQVYFGKIVSNREDEMVLNHVYYLQDVEDTTNTSNTSVTSQSLTKQLSIIKLGSEVHGPTDAIFINKRNILFFEELRDNSKVVETIKSNINK